MLGETRPILTALPDTPPSKRVEFSEVPKSSSFLEAIGRKDLKDKITQKTPWGYFSMECYRHDIQGQGGLGMLAGDTSYQAARIGLPLVMVTPFYIREVQQEIHNFWQHEVSRSASPTERGFQPAGTVKIRTNGHNEVPLAMYKKKEGVVTTIVVTEPNFGEVYQGEKDEDHRLYQEVALGFGGRKALVDLGIKPSVNQLNEAPTVFAAIAELDEMVRESKDLKGSIRNLKAKTIYTNHTLVQAVEGEFNIGQFEHFVLPNIEHQEVREWVRSKFRDGKIRLSTLAMELAGKNNGVSRLHAQEARKQFRDFKGNPVQFEAVTNGISLDRWMQPDLLKLYRENGILDATDRPTEDYQEKIENLDGMWLRSLKDQAKADLREKLKHMKDQYGKPIDIPEGEKMYGFMRRVAGYKRFGKMFDDPEQLARLLESEGIHILLAGKAHAKDMPMKGELKRIFELIDGNEVLRKRVHFIQNYNESVSKPAVQGVDVWINLPIVRDEAGRKTSTEADGTSKDKTVGNLALLLSTEDGGVADPTLIEENGEVVLPGDKSPYYLKVRGENDAKERAWLYWQMRRSSRIIDGADPQYTWEGFVKRQLAANLPNFAGGVMMEKYVNLAFPQAT